MELYTELKSVVDTQLELHPELRLTSFRYVRKNNTVEEFGVTAQLEKHRAVQHIEDNTRVSTIITNSVKPFTSQFRSPTICETKVVFKKDAVNLDVSLEISPQTFNSFINILESRENIDLSQDQKTATTFTLSDNSYVYNQHSNLLNTQTIDENSTLKQTLNKVSLFQLQCSLKQFNFVLQKLSVGYSLSDSESQKPQIQFNFTTNDYSIHSQISDLPENPLQ